MGLSERVGDEGINETADVLYLICKALFLNIY